MRRYRKQPKMQSTLDFFGKDHIDKWFLEPKSKTVDYLEKSSSKPEP